MVVRMHYCAGTRRPQTTAHCAPRSTEHHMVYGMTQCRPKGLEWDS